MEPLSPALAGGFLITEPPGKSPPPPDLYVVWILTLFSSCSGVVFQGGPSKLLLAKTAFQVTIFHHIALISSQHSLRFVLASSTVRAGPLPVLPATAAISSGQSLSHVQLFATPWTAAHQASLSITSSWSLLKLMSISDAIQPSHPLSSPSLPAFNLS